MRPIKFRQPCFNNDGSFSHWHYWGWMSKGEFVSPLSMGHNVNGELGLQFTGLLDKNGKEIYEGDIIQYGAFALNDTEKFGKEPWRNLPEGVERDDITTVKSRNAVTFDIPSLYAIKQAIEDNPDVNGVEVIGNIYENPELLDE